MTPHINAKPGDFAQTVLMPGDPNRAKFIAETFLENAVLVNSVRGVNGYTGSYQGKRVSVMASGMGMPSMGIYSYELFNSYDVRRIIRVGTAGAISPALKLKSVVIGMSASYQSDFMSQYQLPGVYAPCASFPLLLAAYEAARRMELDCHVGPIVSGDCFYSDVPQDGWSRMGLLAGEMEAAALYATAARAGKEAVCICTISDIAIGGVEQHSTPEEREHSFTDMIRLALEIA